MTIRLIQLQKGTDRRVGLISEPQIEWLDTPTIYYLVQVALKSDISLHALIDTLRKGIFLSYDSIYQGTSDWKILPCLDHPTDPAHCLLSGTGGTHLGTAPNRNETHAKTLAAAEDTLTDSMKLFRWGLESGKPAPGSIGAAPQLFSKGNGNLLRAHNDPLDIPSFAQGGGEEAEIVGIYLIDSQGRPTRVGMAQGNEFADQAFERKNPIYLAGAKLRTCSIGPELVLDPAFTTIHGTASILRNDAVLWSKPQLTGENELSHSLANLEHHLFKFPHHRHPGDVHIHYFGTSGTSFGAGIRLEDKDIMQIHFEGFGRPLRNPVRTTNTSDSLIKVMPLH